MNSDEETCGELTNPTLQTGARINLDNIWWVYPNIEAQH